jgi:hypothetical protein
MIIIFTWTNAQGSPAMKAAAQLEQVPRLGDHVILFEHLPGNPKPGSDQIAGVVERVTWHATSTPPTVVVSLRIDP